jgi:hypothetical protein
MHRLAEDRAPVDRARRKVELPGQPGRRRSRCGNGERRKQDGEQ